MGREPARLVFAAFSQGVAMGFRAATATTRRVDGVIAVGGDVPPEIDAAALCPREEGARLSRRRATSGIRTRSSSTTISRLRQSGVAVHAVTFEGGHEWSKPF